MMIVAVSTKDNILIGISDLKRTTYLVPTDDGRIPRRKSKFLKMLKKYTESNYGKNIMDEPKSPALQNLAQAKQDLKKISAKMSTFGLDIERMKKKIERDNIKTVTKITNVNELFKKKEVSKRESSNLRFNLPSKSSISESSEGMYLN